MNCSCDVGDSWDEVGEGLLDVYWGSVLCDVVCVDGVDLIGIYVGIWDGCVYVSVDEGDSFV